MRVEGGCGGGEGVGDMAVEVVIGVCAGQTAHRLIESEPLICKLFLHFRDLVCVADDLGAGGTIADDFCTEGVVTLLTHGPVDTFRMCLVVCEEELLAVVKGGAREFVGMSMQMFGMDRTASSVGAEQLRTSSVLVDHNKGGDLVAAIIRWDLEHIMYGVFFEVHLPLRTRVDVGLGASRRGGPCFILLLLCNPSNLCIYIALHQRIHDLFEGGSWV